MRAVPITILVVGFLAVVSACLVVVYYYNFAAAHFPHEVVKYSDSPSVVYDAWTVEVDAEISDGRIDYKALEKRILEKEDRDINQYFYNKIDCVAERHRLKLFLLLIEMGYRDDKIQKMGKDLEKSVNDVRDNELSAHDKHLRKKFLSVMAKLKETNDLL